MRVEAVKKKVILNHEGGEKDGLLVTRRGVYILACVMGRIYNRLLI